MASTLVGVRLPEPTLKKVRRLRKKLGLASDAATIRRMIEEYPVPMRPSMMPVFSAPIRSKGRQRRRDLSASIDDVVYGK